MRFLVAGSQLLRLLYAHAKICAMNDDEPSVPDIETIEAKLHRWRSQHNTPDKVVASHRAVILDRVVQSMEFEKDSITVARLKSLLETCTKNPNR
ncbi:MAG: hypothetical protein NPIRA06_15590 [Nitrospirales bacterium]|nr:MAG: hypothetical protein NPIRA06_15590 [Nitrospirales bacterium]